MAVPIVTAVAVDSPTNTIVLTVTFAAFVSKVFLNPIEIVDFGFEGIDNNSLFIRLSNGRVYNSMKYTNLTGLPYANNVSFFAALSAFYATVLGNSYFFRAGSCVVVGNTNFTLQSDAMTDANNYMVANPTRKLLGPVNIYRNTTAGKYEWTLTYSV